MAFKASLVARSLLGCVLDQGGHLPRVLPCCSGALGPCLLVEEMGVARCWGTCDRPRSCSDC